MLQISEAALAVRALARQHQEAIWAGQLTVNRLRSVFLEFYPNALAAFPILTHKAALEVLGAAPTPGMALKLTRKRVVTLLQRSGRGDRPGLADTIIVKLGSPPCVATGGRRCPGPSRHRSGLGHQVDGGIDRQPRGRHDYRIRGPRRRPSPDRCPRSGHHSRRPGPRRDRRRPDPLRHRRWTQSLCRHGADNPGLGPLQVGHAATSRTGAWPTPATGGPSPRSPNPPDAEPTTTVDAQPATLITQRFATWPTTPRPPVVVPGQRPRLGRKRSVANLELHPRKIAA